MQVLISEKLSEHKYKTPEGYLICVDAVLARTGKQEYRKNEIFDTNDDSIIEVDRKPEEVFAKETLASFENKPITVEHPDVQVNAENNKDYSVGFVRDVHQGIVDGNDVILGTLVITDADTIREIENGEHTDLSCGYDCDIDDSDNPQQKNIRGNHVALCQCGRAGIAKIMDSIADSKKIKFTYNNGQVGYTSQEEIDNKYDNDMFWFTDNPKNIDTYGNIKSGWTLLKSSVDKKYMHIFDSVEDAVPNWFSSLAREAKNKFGNNLDKIRNYIKENCGMSWNEIYENYQMIAGKFEFPIWENEDGQFTKDANKLPTKVRTTLQKFLGHKSTFIKNKDYDVSELVHEFERAAKTLADFPVTVTRESIKGWFKTGDGMMRKDYSFSVDGYDDKFLVSLYAKPDTYETTEINAYFTDSIEDASETLSKIKTLLNTNIAGSANSWNDYVYDINDYTSNRFKDEFYEIRLYDNISSKTIGPKLQQYLKSKLPNCKINYDGSSYSISISKAKNTNDAEETNMNDSYKNNIEDANAPVEVSHDNIRETIKYVYQSDVDKNLYFYIGATHSVKEGEWTYTQYKNLVTPEELAKDIEGQGWHKVSKGPNSFIDSVKDTIKDADISTYKSLAKEINNKFNAKASGDNYGIYCPKAYDNSSLNRQIVNFLNSKGYKVEWNSVGDDGYYYINDSVNTDDCDLAKDSIKDTRMYVDITTVDVTYSDRIAKKYGIKFIKGDYNEATKEYENSYFEGPKDVLKKIEEKYEIEDSVDVDDSEVDEVIRQLNIAIPQGTTYEAGDRDGLFAQIQNHGMVTYNMTPGKEDKTGKTSSAALGRIWYNGKLIFMSQSKPIRVCQAEMINFLKSNRDKM